MLALLEKYWPISISLITVILYAVFGVKMTGFDLIFQDVTDKSLNVSGTLIGFFLTIFTILETIKTRRMEFIRSAGLFPRVKGFLVSGIVWHLINICLILIVPFVAALELHLVFEKCWTGLMVFVIMMSLTHTIRFTTIFLRLLQDPE